MPILYCIFHNTSFIFIQQATFPNAYKQGKTCQEQLYILLTNQKSCASDQEELGKT